MKNKAENRVGMIGWRSGKLKVVSYSHTAKKRAMWNCLCDCGRRHVAMGKYLRRREIKSCGCLNRQSMSGPSNFIHGHSAGAGFSPTYATWSSMIQRCENRRNPTYYKYGGRGISICEEWHVFASFLKDMGERPTGMTIGRKDNDGDYSKANCEWQTPVQQGANTRKNRFIRFNGRKLHLAEWARVLGISSSTMHTRLKKWSKKKALSTGKLR